MLLTRFFCLFPKKRRHAGISSQNFSSGYMQILFISPREKCLVILYQVSIESFQQEKDPQKFSFDGNGINCALRFSFNFCLPLSDSIFIEIWSPRGTRFNLSTNLYASLWFGLCDQLTSDYLH